MQFSLSLLTYLYTHHIICIGYRMRGEVIFFLLLEERYIAQASPGAKIRLHFQIIYDLDSVPHECNIIVKNALDLQKETKNNLYLLIN